MPDRDVPQTVRGRGRFFVDLHPGGTSYAVYDSERPNAWTGADIVAGPFMSKTAAQVCAGHRNDVLEAEAPDAL